MASVITSQTATITFIKKVIDNYMKSQGKIRAHFLLSGKSGTGKSFILEQLARKQGLSFLNINAAQLTREGISGNSLSKALDGLRKLQGKPVMVLFDEFDKLFNGVNGGTGDERSGVQSEILHIISSGEAQIIGQYGHYDTINTSNVIFVFAGAFLGQENLSPEKLMKMGMFPELLGRVNLHVSLPEIECKELIEAMKKDPLLIEYCNTNALTKEQVEETKDCIAAEITKQYTTNVIGYRMIQRLIHQYFLFDGVFPVYAEEASFLEDEDDEQLDKELSFGE